MVITYLTYMLHHEPKNSRRYHKDDFVLALVVDMMAHKAFTKMLIYWSDKVIAKTRGQIN
jgi:hypothetical protein